MEETNYQFKAEVKQLLNILVHSLYQDREIFLRELISNASDALARVHFEMLTNKEVVHPEAELAVWIETAGDGDEQKIVVRDSGIGMMRDELVENLGTIAQSGARNFLATLSKEGRGEADLSEIIGQFGVGFYSVFMVADQVRVISRSYRPDAEAAAWISEGDDSFRIEPAEKEDRGTEVHIWLKKDADEFANSWRLRTIVRKHSDFVRYPIYIEGQQANQQQSIWRQSPQSVSEADYQKFYQSLTLESEPPLATVHFASDVPLHVRALLFIPSKRERTMLALRTEPGVKLYSHNVLIQEYCTELLPAWLGFVDGVVDSEDLPLNVSRETVQNNRLMRNLAKIVTGRVIRRLQELSDEESERYERFWRQFGRAVKEGLATDPTSRDDILPLLRFYTSRSGDDLISLDAYLERMAEGQEAIYYVLGDDLASVRRSPHLDPFQARKLEVLTFVDPVDPFITPMLTEYQSKPFRNIDDAGLELPELDEANAPDTDEQTIAEADFNRFIGRCVTVLGDRVIEVRPSKVLRESPVRLVSPGDTPDRELQRVYRMLDQAYETPKRILEVNRQHPLIADLAHLATEEPESELLTLSIEQLYASALVQEGLHPNPAEMVPRIQKLMELAASQAGER